MKKTLWILLTLFICVVCGSVGYIYHNQEGLLFQTNTLPQDYQFNCNVPFEEIFLDTDKDVRINGLYFFAKSPKGVVLYFHGRGKNLSDPWEKIAHEFTSRGYEFFIMDYRGFGKSRGELHEKGICHDAKACYRFLKNRFQENRIIVYGRSLGTGIATYVASNHHPKMLVLESPYFSILDLIPRQHPYLPKALVPLILKYHLRTDLWITKVRSPIRIFHGTEDELVPYDSSLRLIGLLKHKLDAKLIPLEKGRHTHLRTHPTYQSELDTILR